jgi:hypothetical protein
LTARDQRRPVPVAGDQGHRTRHKRGRDDHTGQFAPQRRGVLFCQRWLRAGFAFGSACVLGAWKNHQKIRAEGADFFRNVGLRASAD